MVFTSLKAIPSQTLSYLEPRSTVWQSAVTSPDGANSNSIIEWTDALGVSSEAKTPALTSASSGRFPSCCPHYAGGWDSVSSLQDVDADHFEDTVLQPLNRLDKDSPSVSMTGGVGLARRPSVSDGSALSKRKCPKLFTQLTHELQWMRNNFSRVYEHSATARLSGTSGTLQGLSSRLLDPACTIADNDQNEDLLITTSLRSSIRRPSPVKKAMANNRGSSSTLRGPWRKSGREPRWHVLERSGVEQTQPTVLQEVTSNLYAPRSCQYVLRQSDVAVTEEDGRNRACISGHAGSL